MPLRKSKKGSGIAAYNKLHKADIAKRNREDKKALSYLTKSKPKRKRGGRK